MDQSASAELFDHQSRLLNKGIKTERFGHCVVNLDQKVINESHPSGQEMF